MGFSFHSIEDLFKLLRRNLVNTFKWKSMEGVQFQSNLQQYLPFTWTEKQPVMVDDVEENHKP